MDEASAMSLLKIMSKVAVACKSSDEFSHFIETQEVPAIKLSQQEMALLSGGFWRELYAAVCAYSHKINQAQGLES